MNQHLSEDQISHWIMGQRTAADEAHVRECAACRAEVERLRDDLALFRESGERWSAHWYQTPARLAPRYTWPRFALAACGTAVLAIAVIVSPKRPVKVAAEPPFVEIPYVAPLAPYERTAVMRMEVPVAALIAAGLEVHGPEPGSTLTADVLVGQDGQPRAIRLISYRRFQ
jgi:hypothetical protein